MIIPPSGAEVSGAASQQFVWIGLRESFDGLSTCCIIRGLRPLLSENLDILSSYSNHSLAHDLWILTPLSSLLFNAVVAILSIYLLCGGREGGGIAGFVGGLVESWTDGRKCHASLPFVS